MSPYFDLKDLTNRVVKRSFEYEAADDAESLEAVVDVPVVVARQMGATPRMLFTEIVRCRILVMGLNRKAALLSGDGAALTTELKKESTAMADRIERIERAAEFCSGQDAWARLHDILGEERFFEYVENIIYGDEASFLARCGDVSCVADAVSLLDAPPRVE
jgi:hypothetical protein